MEIKGAYVQSRPKVPKVRLEMLIEHSTSTTDSEILLAKLKSVEITFVVTRIPIRSLSYY